MRDFCFSEQKAELIASRLIESHLVEKDVIVSYYRKQYKDLSRAFNVKGSPCYCHDMVKLFQTLGKVYIADE